jgi:hypothetical protein
VPFEIVGDIAQIETIATGGEVFGNSRGCEGSMVEAVAEAEGDCPRPSAEWAPIKRKRYVG